MRELLKQADVAALVEAVKGLSVSGGVAGKMRVVYEAVLGDAEEGTKLADVIKANVAGLKPYSKDKPTQLAQLIALEHFLTGVCELLGWVFSGLVPCSAASRVGVETQCCVEM